jgi:hypothetical protein
LTESLSLCSYVSVDAIFMLSIQKYICDLRFKKRIWKMR